MSETSVDVRTGVDGTMVIKPHGAVDAGCAVLLRQMLVHAIRKVRPLRLVVDLGEVTEVDPINLGTLAALCDLADDQNVVVVIEHASTAIAVELRAAGVPAQRLGGRRSAKPVANPIAAPERDPAP